MEKNLPPGQSLTGDVSATCWQSIDSEAGTGRGCTVVGYGDSAGNDCAVLTRDADDPRRYTVDVAAAEVVSTLLGRAIVGGCAAYVYEFTYTRTGDSWKNYEYKYDYTFLGYESAPLNPSITLQRSV